MKWVRLIMMICVCSSSYSATRYVALGGGHDAVGGYTNWTGAATSIIDAVNAAQPGETILVSNGLYKLTNQITLGANSMRSWNNGVTDRAGTIIDGDFYDSKPVTNRCVEITGASARLDGFTISNGCVRSAGGAGILVAAAADYVIITNCFITQNTTTITTTSSGAGVRMNGVGGILTHCLVVSNSAPMSSSAAAGGAYLFGTDNTMEFCDVGYNQAQTAAGVAVNAGNRVSNCRIYGNSAGSWGGGFYLNAPDAVLEGCVVSNNSAGGTGGGAAYLRRGALRNCILVDNRTPANYGGGLYVNDPVAELTIESCLFVNNVASNASAAYGGGLAIRHVGAGTGNVQLLNSTFTGNWGRNGNGGGIWMEVSAANADKVAIKNTIAAGNKVGAFDRDIDAVGTIGDAAATNGFVFCCSPTFDYFPPGQGSLRTDPLFVSSTDYRLQSVSPCVNAGTNQSWMAESLDLDGHSRIDRYSGRVDIGCYEYFLKGTLFGIH